MPSDEGARTRKVTGTDSPGPMAPTRVLSPERTSTAPPLSRTLSIVTVMSALLVLSEVPPSGFARFSFSVRLAADAVFRMVAVIVPTSPGWRTAGVMV